MKKIIFTTILFCAVLFTPQMMRAAVLNAETPTINVQPQSVTVKIGATPKLSVTASVLDGTLSYQWYANTTNSNKGGTPIAGATNSSYTLPKLTTAGTFYFYVVVTNTNNKATGSTTAKATSDVATVTVQAAVVNAETPVITKQPQDVTINVGEAATLSVTATVSDGGTLSYKWYNDNTGIEVSAASSFSFTPTTEGVYPYSVVVTNTNSNATNNKTATATSNVATVTVTVPVCSIGTTPYASLDDALAAVPTGGTTPTTIKLLANIDYSSTLTVSSKKITFDLNGKNLNVVNTTNRALLVEGGNVFLSGIGNFNVTSTVGEGAYINSGYDTATVTNATGGGTGVYARQGAELNVLGNVTATAALSVGANAGGGGRGGTKITIDGTITVPTTGIYIVVGTTYKTKNDYEAVTTKSGYLTYTDGTSTVWVKSTGAGPTITTTSLPNGTAGTAYNQTLQATGDKPITWSIATGSLPGGLSLAGTTGVISGTPTASGTFSFTVQAANATAIVQKALSIVIAAAPTYTLAASPLTSFGSLQAPYTQPAAQTVTVTNTGTGSVTLNQPTAKNYAIGTLSTTNLAAGAKATFTVQPKANLTAGNYDETISISGTGGTSGKVAVNATVNASFTVKKGTDIETVSQATGLKAWVTNGTLHVSGLTAGKSWNLYNIAGTLINQGIATGNEDILSTTSLSHGIYIVRSGNQTVKVIN